MRNIKQLLGLILTLVMALAFCACSKEKKETKLEETVPEAMLVVEVPTEEILPEHTLPPDAQIDEALLGSWQYGMVIGNTGEILDEYALLGRPL